MNSVESKALPVPPNWMKALLAGFDTVANHIGLIIFPVALDLLLWLGPQVRITGLLQNYLDWSQRVVGAQNPEMVDLIESNRQALLGIIDQLSVLGSLRTLPIGVPSLMAGRQLTDIPIGPAPSVQITSLIVLVVAWFILIGFGLFVGSLYFSLINQATLPEKVTLRQTLKKMPNTYLRVVVLSFFALACFIALCIPLSCVLPFLLLGTSGLAEIMLFVYVAFLAWLFLPLIFSPFGIFIHDDQTWVSVLRGARLVRLTLTRTSMFLLAVIVISIGLDMLWNLPPNDSWLTLVGVLGHAFVASGLVAATFFYYRDMERYVNQRMQYHSA